MPTVEQYSLFWKSFERQVAKKSRYPLYWKSSLASNLTHIAGNQQYVTPKSQKYEDKRPRVVIKIYNESFQIDIGGLVIVLYSDYAPLTCKHFLTYCDEHEGLPYEGCYLDRIIPEFFFVMGGASCNKCLKSRDIPIDKMSMVKHDEPGILSMRCFQRDSSGSRFLITFKKRPSMDGRYVAFGKVIRGLATLEKIHRFASYGSPHAALKISKVKEV